MNSDKQTKRKERKKEKERRKRKTKKEEHDQQEGEQEAGPDSRFSQQLAAKELLVKARARAFEGVADCVLYGANKAFPSLTRLQEVRRLSMLHYHTNEAPAAMTVSLITRDDEYEVQEKDEEEWNGCRRRGSRCSKGTRSEGGGEGRRKFKASECVGGGRGVGQEKEEEEEDCWEDWRKGRKQR